MTRSSQRRSRASHRHSSHRLAFIRRQFVLERLEDRTLLSSINWVGVGDGTSWLDPNNWNTKALPGPNDDVTINVASNPTIHLDSGDVTVRSLQLSEDLTLAGRSFTVTNGFPR